VRQSRDVVAQLQGALSSRVVIEQAKGVLAERAQIGVDAAFARTARARAQPPPQRHRARADRRATGRRRTREQDARSCFFRALKIAASVSERGAP
jgi:hypothetical protein